MTAPPPVLGGGLWLHVVLEFGNCDGARLGAEAHAIGARGLIIHSIGTATPSLRWIERETPRLGRPFQLAVGIGSRGPRKWKDHFAQPVVDTLKAGFRAVPDWEKAWSGPEGRPAGARVATYVLDFVQDAVGFVADNPWWAPLYFLREQKGKTRKVNTHPNAPTREFGRLCATRYVQAYPLVMDGLQTDGAAAALLKWSRDPSQYEACGTPSAAVFATVRGYSRSTADVCSFALAEPHHVVYVGSRKDKPNETTPAVRAGLVAARAIAALGHGSVEAFQRAAGLKPDGVCGPRTLAALAAP